MPTKFTDAEKAALCTSCSLSTAMMDCPRCAFALGKAVREEQLVAIQVEKAVWEVHLRTLELADDYDALEVFWDSLPEWLWDAYNNKMQENAWGVSGQNTLTRVLA